MRICITGGPRTGKTTLAKEMLHALIGDTRGEWGVMYCDDWISHERFASLPQREQWSATSALIAERLSTLGTKFIVEGVQVPRAIRKFIEAHPGKRPCDRLVILNTPHVELTAGQAAMAKGVHTVLAEVLPELRRLGVEIEERR